MRSRELCRVLKEPFEPHPVRHGVLQLPALRRIERSGLAAAESSVNMSIFSIAKRYVPKPLHTPLRKCLNLLRGPSRYQLRVQGEFESFEGVNVRDLPAI